MFPGMIYGPVAGAIMGLMVAAMFFTGFSVTLPWLGLVTVTATFLQADGACLGAIIGLGTAFWLSKHG
jgi:hypothetical protein